MDRRQFLSGLAVAGLTTACATSSKKSSKGAPSTAAQPVETAVPTTPSTPLPDGIFSLGVASGDPTDSAVVLWTRLASAATSPDGGPPTGDVQVAFDVARDEAFKDLVASDIAVARPDLGHSIHVDVTNLDPDSWYYYRFRVDGQTSPVGRTRTFPAPTAKADHFRFIFASCQDYQWGTYVLWKHAAAEKPDAVVFLGDYIYELSLGDLSPAQDGSRVWASPPPTDLATYRARYAQTKSDPHLQAAHATAPWIITFDDHEVANNYAGDVGQGDVDQPRSRDRRLAAYQAFYEHQPIRVTPEPDSFDSLELQRSLRFGTLADLAVIETRQYADAPACRTDASLISDEGPSCAALEDPKRTNLGAAQESWLADTIAASKGTWFVLCNPVMFASINTGTAEAPTYTRDVWDGYPAARQRVIDAITTAKVPNPVVVTGDWHASFVNDVAASAGGATVMPEFVGSSISTVIFGTDYRAANPHIRYFLGEHCYASVTVTPESFTCAYVYVENIWDENAPISHTDTWSVTAGSHEATQD